MALSSFKIRKQASDREKLAEEMDCMFSVNRGPLTPRKRDASQFEECRRRAQIQRMKNAFRTLSFRSEPTIGEEHLRRSEKCTAEAPSTRGDLIVEKKYEDLIHDFVPDCFKHIQNFHHYRSDLARINSGFKVIYLSDSERTENSENELRKVYKQYVKSVSPNSSFKGHLQRVRGNTMQPEKIENKNEVAKDTLTLSQECRYEGIEKCGRRLEVSTRYSNLEVLGEDTWRTCTDSNESTSDIEDPRGKLEKAAGKSMPSQPSFQSIDSNFSGTKPPVTTPNRMSRGSSVRTLVYENRKGNKSVNLNGTSFRLEPSAWQAEQNHCPHGLAPFHSRFPHLKASSLPSSPTRQRWSETATPPWQQYRVLCDAFRPNNSPKSVVCRKRYPNGYKRPKFASTTELEYYIHVVSEAYVWMRYVCVNKLV